MKPKNIKLALIALIICVAGAFVSCNKDDNTVEVTGIRISSSELSLIPGKPYTLTASVLPREATNKEVTWGSSGNAATVDDNGVVTPVSVGKVTITVTSVAKPEIKASCTVNVTAAPVEVTAISLQVDGEDGPVNVPAEGIAIENLGDRMTLGFVANPGNATANAFFVSYASSNEEIATVDWETGTVISVAVGEATITATVNKFKDDGSYEPTGIKATCKVKTGIWVESIEFEGEAPANFYTGYEHATKLVWVPDNTTDKTVAYTFSAADIVSISETGVVTGIAPGEVTITATTTNSFGEKATATSYKITVLEPVVAVNVPALKVGVGAKYMICNVTPLGVTPAITWTSDNSCVTVNSATGEITAVSAGTANIGATFSGKTLTCAVTVDASVPNGNIGVGADDLPGLMKGAVDGAVFYFKAGEEYTSAELTIRKDVTLKGVTGGVHPKIVTSADWKIASDDRIANIIIEGLDFVAAQQPAVGTANPDPVLSCLFKCDNNAVNNLGIITFKDCTFDSYQSGVFQVQGTTNSIDELLMEDCIVKNFNGANNFGIIALGNTSSNCEKFGKITIKNSTFNNNANSNVIGLNSYSKDIEINVESCTFYDVNSNNQLFRLDNAAKLDLKFSNCIFAKNQGANIRVMMTRRDREGSTQFYSLPEGVTVTSIGNYGTTDFIQRDNYASDPLDTRDKLCMVDYTEYGSSSDLFEILPNGICKIKDDDFPGKSTAGDPRGRME